MCCGPDPTGLVGGCRSCWRTCQHKHAGWEFRLELAARASRRHGRSAGSGQERLGGTVTPGIVLHHSLLHRAFFPEAIDVGIHRRQELGVDPDCPDRHVSVVVQKASWRLASRCSSVTSRIRRHHGQFSRGGFVSIFVQPNFPGRVGDAVEDVVCCGGSGHCQVRGRLALSVFCRAKPGKPESGVEVVVGEGYFPVKVASADVESVERVGGEL